MGKFDVDKEVVDGALMVEVAVEEPVETVWKMVELDVDV